MVYATRVEASQSFVGNGKDGSQFLTERRAGMVKQDSRGRQKSTYGYCSA